MARITWLHLSDWQQEADEDFERKDVINALLEDIRNRISIDSTLTKIDFVVFSGDVAFSGQAREYQAVKEALFSPLVRALEWSESEARRRLFIVPGNHDLDREQFKRLPDLNFASEEQVGQWLTDDKRRARLLQPFAAFRKFISTYTNQKQPDYATTSIIPEIDGKRVALFGLNSALMSGRVNDYGSLIVGEAQVNDALQEAIRADISIAVLHHPLESLAEFDRLRIQEQLERNCQFILHGHHHTPKITVQSSATGGSLVIPAGSSYGGQRGSNIGAYNFVHLDTDVAQGVVYLRRWNERRSKWVADLESYDDGKLQFRLLASSMLNPSNSSVRVQASQSLGRLGQTTPEVVDTLLQTLHDSNADVRVQAARSLGQLGQAVPEGAALLPQSLQSTSSITDDEQSKGETQAAEHQVEGTREQSEQVEVAVRALADTPSEVDWLGFSVYADALVDFIVNENTKTPLSIAIDGAWGEGKTTLMHMIENRLKMQRKKTVRFNAWKYDQEASLWAALALEILKQVRDDFNAWQKARFWWNLSSKRLAGNLFLSALLKSLPYVIGLLVLGGLAFAIAWLWQGNAWIETLKNWYITIVGPLLGGLVVLSTFGKEAYNKVIKPFDLKIAKYVRTPDYKERIGFLAQFEEDFKLVIGAITEGENGLLVVFIDDLDRCAPPKPVEIIEAINILLDAKHCVFVLGMDTQTVARSIEAKYNGLHDSLKEVNDPGGLTLGQRFLEKIVQITFHIPRTSDPEVVKSFIHNNLKVKDDQADGSLPDKEIKEAERLIEAKQRAGKPLDEAANSVQAARPDIKVESVEKAKQNVFARSFDDSEDVRRAIYEAASYLQFNPRRIKRFINIFRLQAFIANRRNLLAPGKVQLDLLAKWITIVTRWPTMAEGMAIDPNFVQSLLGVYDIQEQLRDGFQADDGFLESEHGKRLQAKLNRYLEDPYKKRLIDASKLRYLLKQMTESETKTLYQYLYLAQTVIDTGIIEQRSPIR